VGVAPARQWAVYRYVVLYDGRLHYIEVEAGGPNCGIEVYRDGVRLRYSLGEDGERLRIEFPLADYPAGVARFPVTGYADDSEIELFLDELQTVFKKGDVLCERVEVAER